ncbi:MAG: deoxynucleoside kinase [Deltaproteobacteria bacterium]|nr:deoxynucleoside kinase [Deltaproteobacteria bacterium]
MDWQHGRELFDVHELCAAPALSATPARPVAAIRPSAAPTAARGPAVARVRRGPADAGKAIEITDRHAAVRPEDGKHPRQARFVAVAGNIGAGKSTLTAFLASRFGIQPFYEPNDANPYLSDFYADMQRYAFHSQMYFLSAKFRSHLDLARLLDAHPHKVYVQDRTIYEDAEIFARTLHTRGTLSVRDYQTYDCMYRAIRDTLPRPDLLIYLRCSVKGLQRRIRRRGRPEEQAMDPSYLKDLQTAYEDWIGAYDLGPTLVIETERLDYLRDIVDRVQMENALDELLRRP